MAIWVRAPDTPIIAKRPFLSSASLYLSAFSGVCRYRKEEKCRKPTEASQELEVPYYGHGFTGRAIYLPPPPPAALPPTKQLTRGGRKITRQHEQ